MCSNNGFTSGYATAKGALGSLLILGLFVTGTASAGWWWSSDKPDETSDQATASTGNTETRLLNWPDLVPTDYVPPPNPFDELTETELQKLYDGSEESEKEFQRMLAIVNYAPTVDALDGKRVSLPGYIVPLDFDGQTRLSEFLLVPYFGACIHTPPPPANQVVYARLPKAMEIEDTYEPVILTGTLAVETVQSELAETAYQMRVDNVSAFPGSAER